MGKIGALGREAPLVLGKKRLAERTKFCYARDISADRNDCDGCNGGEKRRSRRIFRMSE